jgi:hypothetical protein
LPTSIEEIMSKRSDFDKLRIAVHQLNLVQTRQLYAELGAILFQKSSADQQTESQIEPYVTLELVPAKGREVVETQRIGDRFYQLERIRCGKVGCKCAGKNGELHGPYWYAYWRDDGHLKTCYVGKRLRQVGEG